MKVTDYCPRAAPFDSYLTGQRMVGVEIGVDVGAHAQALLRYCDISMLSLVDPWPNPYCRGYCEGRLSALGYRPRFRMIVCGSLVAAPKFAPTSLDFVYIDQEHDGPAVAADLSAWWPALKSGGVLGYRNYGASNPALVAAIDSFVEIRVGLKAQVETGEIVLLKP